MKTRSSVIVAALMVTLFAVSAFAQLSQEFRDFPTSPAGFLLTDEEKTSWKKVRTDADARAFVDLFWARRDPTPGTPANEFRDEFNVRVEYADRHFTEQKKKGSVTARGQVLIALGPPARFVRSDAAPQGTIQRPTAIGESEAGPGGIQGYSAKQMWVYEQAKTKWQMGIPNADVVFVDQYRNNQWTLERGGKIDVGALMKRANQSYITQPELTAAPAPAAAQPVPAATVQLPAATPAATAGSIGDFKTQSLRAAIDEFKAAKTSPYKNVVVTYTELVSPAGDYFVPVQLYIPKSDGLTADSATTFFGVVEDETGKPVAIFEEPAKLSASRGDLYFDKSLNLAAGKYKATLGLSGADGKPVVMASSPMELKALSKDTTAVSRLVLAADVHETEEAALVGAPYAFGRVKIVPKGDAVFTNKDEINYFIEVINPGIDETTTAPKLQVKLDLVQAGKNGRTISAPISDAPALPLSGAAGAGQYAILSGIPLGQMKNALPAGDYTLRVKVFDQVKKENWTVEQKLKLVDASATPAAK